MEGDAGASRLNPADTDDSSSSQVTAKDLAESEAGTDPTSAGDDADQTSSAEAVTETNAEDASEAESSPVNGRNPSRLGRRWLIGITATLLVVAGGLGTGGYFMLRSDQQSQAIDRHEVDAVNAAKDCVGATQAPDPDAMAAGAQKIIDCSTGDFRNQAILYSSLFVQAYQAANVHVQVSDMRAAAERRNGDGSVDVLVAFRVQVSNSETQKREIGYRLRVKMAPAEGQYRIAKLDQVAK